MAPEHFPRVTMLPLKIARLVVLPWPILEPLPFCVAHRNILIPSSTVDFVAEAC